LLGRILCDGLISRPEESYWVWCVQWEWSRNPGRAGRDLESSRSATKKFVWALLWTKWYWDRFFSKYFGFPLSASAHQR